MVYVDFHQERYSANCLACFDEQSLSGVMLHSGSGREFCPNVPLKWSKIPEPKLTESRYFAGVAKINILLPGPDWKAS
jgi:hypothetical protein